MRRNTKRKTRTRKVSSRKKTGGRKWSQEEATSSTLSGPRVMPDEADVRLQFRDMRTLLNAGSGIMYKEFQANGAYDVDPALASTETFGFDEYAAFYSYYRVIAYDYSVTCVNLEPTFSVNAYLLNTNVQPSGTGGSYMNMSSLPYNKAKLLSPAGSPGCAHTFRGRILISKLLGSRAVETEDSYRALTTGTPTDLIWCSTIVEANGAFLLGNGVATDLKLTMHIRFYGRELDLALSGAARLAKIQKKLEEYQQSRKLLDVVKATRKRCL